MKFKISYTTLIAALTLLFAQISQADVKVAFIADQGTSRNAKRVLALVAAENTQLLLIQGDLGYKKGASEKWEKQLNIALGINFPVLSVVGNHESHEWDNYKQLIVDRVNRVPELTCLGDIGVKALCDFKGLSIVQVAPGISEVDGVKPADDYPDFIMESFETSPAKWRICSWHKNQNAMQIGGKSDETGWGVYQACLNTGAMVATGHAHSYSRTHLLSSFEDQTIVHKENHLKLSERESFAFVSGLGGKKTKKQETDGGWWAAKYSRTQNAKHGALFCTFADITAECYFKSISSPLLFNNDIPDRFTLESLVGD